MMQHLHRTKSQLLARQWPPFSPVSRSAAMKVFSSTLLLAVAASDPFVYATVTKNTIHETEPEPEPAVSRPIYGLPPAGLVHLGYRPPYAGNSQQWTVDSSGHSQQWTVWGPSAVHSPPTTVGELIVNPHHLTRLLYIPFSMRSIFTMTLVPINIQSFNQKK